MTQEHVKKLLGGYILTIEDQTKNSELHGVSSELLYTVAKNDLGVDFYMHNHIINFLVEKGVVELKDDLLKWVGPATGVDLSDTARAE